MDIAGSLDNLPENSFEPVKRKKTVIMRKIKYLSALIISLLLTQINYAQTDTAEMADTMRSNARIYVVVAVVVLILLALLLYLVRLDLKITSIETDES